MFFIDILATIRQPNAAARASLTDFGKYVAEILPKFVQKVQLTAGDELEILISPEGVLPTLQFLKDHHTAQFTSLADIAGMDVPGRKYRFEVSIRNILFFLLNQIVYITYFHIFNILK